MGLTLIIWIVVASISTIVAIFYAREYLTLKNTIKDFYTYNRIGYKDDQTASDYLQVEVEEIERYKNGFSRIKIKNIKVYYRWSVSTTDKKIIDKYMSKFTDIQKTDKWTWLERDEDIMDIRRKKLERIIKDESKN